jgi:hypothetical protein
VVGPPRQFAYYLVPAMAIKAGRLVAGGIQVHLAAAPTGRLGSAVASRFAPSPSGADLTDPKGLHEPGLSPRPAVQPATMSPASLRTKIVSQRPSSHPATVALS